jgi:hypothetical protein
MYPDCCRQTRTKLLSDTGALAALLAMRVCLRSKRPKNNHVSNPSGAETMRRFISLEELGYTRDVGQSFAGMRTWLRANNQPV